ncbi:MAG: Holliday junction branch migration protein RuvA [Ignavibacteriae bacterium]|nr:Holliday junction branch migration protein RuvA [Ignavibacteriota bacterium]
MIATLTGILKTKSPTEIVVNTNGVGYAVSIPLSTFEKIGAVDTAVTLFTHLVVREDALQLYGFATENEREVFRLLITVNGIGPKIAQGILSGITLDELKRHIAGGNISALTSVPGVGKKTAERLVVELREKVSRISPAGISGYPSDEASNVRAEALLALTSLGYQRAVAEKAIRQVLNEQNGKTLSIEELIKSALRFISR